MKHYIIIFALALVGLSSCGIYGQFESPVAEADTVQVPTYDQVFTDPNLQQLIATALMNNLDLKVAHENVNQANACLLGAKLAYIPSIYASPSATYSNQTGQGVWSYGLAQASWEIDIFGRLTNKMWAARASQKQSVDYEQAARSELIAAVAQAYYLLITLDASIEANDSAEATWKHMVEVQREMKNVGLADEAAVAQFEGSYHASRVNGEELRLQRIQVLNAFVPLLGTANVENIKRSKLVDVTGIMPALATVNLKAVKTRPDVRAAEHQLEIAFYNKNYSVANCCPSITLTGSLGLLSGGLLYSAVGSLLQPIFNSGRNIQEVRVAKAQKEAAQYSYSQALLKAGTEVNDALAARDTYIRETEMHTSRVLAMERAFDATNTKMHLGMGTYLEVLTAENALIEATFALIDNRGAILQSQVDLYLAIGGGK